MIDVRLNFKTNIEKACKNTALSRIMAEVSQSIMFAAPVWGPALGIRTYARAERSLSL